MVVEAEDFEPPTLDDGEAFKARYGPVSTVLIDDSGATEPYRNIAVPLNILLSTDDMVIQYKDEGFDEIALEDAVNKGGQ